MFYVYILRSKKNNIHYYGFTSDLQQRLQHHNSGLSKFTSRHIPWELIYFETFNTRSEAILREKYFKSGSGYTYLKSKGIL